MPFNVSNINHCHPENNCKYLFDTNIWLAVLYDFYTASYYEPYVRFFNEIVRNITAPKAVIVIPSLLLSELINRVMHDIYYSEFCNDNPKPEGTRTSKHYKKVYRVSLQYQADLEDACSNIRGFHEKIRFISDNLHEYTCKNLIKNIPSHLDINDYIYTKIALRDSITIVTHDADFEVENIPIITANRELLRLNQL